MKSLKAFATLALFGVIVSAKQNPALRRMDVEARHRDIALDKRAPVPQGGGLGNIITDPFGNNNSSTVETQTTSQQDNNQQTTSTGRGPGDGPTVITTSTTTAQQVQDTPTTTPTSTPVQPTTTTTPPTTTTHPATTTTQAAGTTQARLTTDTYGGTTLYANTGALTNLRASQTATSTDDGAAPTSSPSNSFLGNKTAVAATFTILGIVAAGALVFVGFWFYKKSNRGKLGEEDMWDEASMKEFHGPPPGTAITAPPAAVLDDEYVPGLARKKTILPSQSAGAAGGPITRTKSATSSGRRDIVPDEEPDEMLALPPVKNYDRPRDSAYDIVPAAPPAAAYASQGGYGQGGYGQGYAGYGNAYASSSGAAATSSAAAAGPSSFQPPARRGDHTSFGSGLGNDPFAGTGFTDATRESSFGAGQAGRGAGYNMNAGPGSSSHGHDGQVGLGNQWPQGYNPYHGYAQGSQAPYGGTGYGGYAQ